MPIIYTAGNILEGDTDVIAHGVAAYDIEDMRTGLAKTIRARWPETFRRFKRARRLGFKPGEVFVDWDNQPAVAYLATQTGLYRAQLPLINQAARGLRQILESRKIGSCSIPKIGCGLGKLNWNDVKQIFEEKLGESFVNFFVYV